MVTHYNRRNSRWLWWISVIPKRGVSWVLKLTLLGPNRHIWASTFYRGYVFDPKTIQIEW